LPEETAILRALIVARWSPSYHSSDWSSSENDLLSVALNKSLDCVSRQYTCSLPLNVIRRKNHRILRLLFFTKTYGLSLWTDVLRPAVNACYFGENHEEAEQK